MSDLTDHEHYGQLAPIIDLLAKKRYPDTQTWCNDLNGRAKCHVCDCDLNDMDFIAVRAHGINHLKERNLLPFV